MIDLLTLAAQTLGVLIAVAVGLIGVAIASAGPSKSCRNGPEPPGRRRPPPPPRPRGPLPPASPAPPPPYRMCHGCPACRAEARTWWEIAGAGMLPISQIRAFEDIPPRTEMD